MLALTACGEKQADSDRPAFKAPPLPDFTTYKDVQEKKQAFFDYLLPLITEANQRVLEQRALAEKWARDEELTEKELQRLTRMMENYRVKADDKAGQKEILLNRVNIIPPSLVLAQAANESAWGTSRFATEGNNLFGQWCFSKGCGLVPSSRNDGAVHEVRKFRSPMESVESYIQNLNRHAKYRQLRLIRHRLQEENGTSAVDVEVLNKGDTLHWRGLGKGPLEALVAGLPVKVEIMDYHEHAIGSGSNAKAAAYVEIRLDNGRPLHGIGIDENLTTASFRALFSALNRALRQAEAQAA